MDGIENNTKTVLSVRILPEEKQRLIEQANALGIKLSEHAENILLNAQKIQVNDETDNLKREKLELVTQVRQLTDQLTLLKNPTLIKLFEQVKGMKDEVTATDGKTYTITYNTPADLLLAMILSYKLKI